LTRHQEGKKGNLKDERGDKRLDMVEEGGHCVNLHETETKSLADFFMTCTET
jgi:hypothetical protein